MRLHEYDRGNTPTLASQTEIMPIHTVSVYGYNPEQDEDIVYPTRNCGIMYDVGSSHPGAGEGPKGLAVRQLKRYASWVQTVVRQVGPYPSWA